MPADSVSPTVIFLRALHGQIPTEDQLQALNPDWADLVQAALDATPVNRRAAVILIKSGQSDSERLLGILRGNPAPQDRPWPEPTPFGTPRLPTFPDRALPGWIGIYVRSESRATQTPVDLAAMLALAVLSSSLAGPIVLNPWGDWIEPLNLFTIVVLPPGHRKSAIFNSIVAPLHQFEAEASRVAAPLIALARRRQHAAEQALIRAQDAASSVPDDDPRRPQLLEDVERRLHDLVDAEAPAAPRLIADDCSPERLAMLLAAHGGRLAILSPEGGIFDLIAGRYSTTGAPNLDHYLKGHAGDPIVVDRVGRPGEIIPRPALTIGLAVQPEVLRSLLARPGFHGRGLLARFLYSVPSTTLGHRQVDLEPVNSGIRTYYHRQIRALLALTHPAPPASAAAPRTPGASALAPSLGARPSWPPSSPDHSPATSRPLSSPDHPPASSRPLSSTDHPPAPSWPLTSHAHPPQRQSNPSPHPNQLRQPRSDDSPRPDHLPLPLGCGDVRFPGSHPTGRDEGRPDASIPTIQGQSDTGRLRPSPAHGGGVGGRGYSSSPLVLPFDDYAADRLREFAESIEPRLAPDGDLDPIVDWASKLVGATARIAGLLHLASLDLPHPHPDDPPPADPLPLSRLRERGSGGEGVSDFAVESAILIAGYLTEHAKAAYAAMGLDPTVANVPALLSWIKRTGRASFTRRDALRASPRHLRIAADLDDALDQLEHHGYIRFRPQQRHPGQGRPASPVYDVHPSLVTRQPAPPLPRQGEGAGG